MTSTDDNENISARDDIEGHGLPGAVNVKETAETDDTENTDDVQGHLRTNVNEAVETDDVQRPPKRRPPGHVREPAGTDDVQGHGVMVAQVNENADTDERDTKPQSVDRLGR